MPEPRNLPCCGYFADCGKPWCHCYSKLFQPPEPQLSTPDIRPLAPGCMSSKLGFRICAGARPGQTGVAEWKPCLEGLRQDCGGFVDRASGLLSLVSVPGGRIRAGCAQNPSSANAASSLLSLTFSIQKLHAVVLETGTSAQHTYYSLSRHGCKGSKLGFRIWVGARPGQTGAAE